MSELDTLDLFSLEICALEEWVSSSLDRDPHVRTMFYMMTRYADIGACLGAHTYIPKIEVS